MTHPRIQWSTDIEQHAGWKGGNVINADIVQGSDRGFSGSGGDLRKDAAAVVEVGLNVIHDDIVNTVAPAILSRSAIVGDAVADQKSSSHMADDAVADGNVGDLTG